MVMDYYSDLQRSVFDTNPVTDVKDGTNKMEKAQAAFSLNKAQLGAKVA